MEARPHSDMRGFFALTNPKRGPLHIIVPLMSKKQFEMFAAIGEALADKQKETSVEK